MLQIHQILELSATLEGNPVPTSCDTRALGPRSPLPRVWRSPFWAGHPRGLTPHMPFCVCFPPQALWARGRPRGCGGVGLAPVSGR